MTPLKTLMLASLTVMSLGAGTAMAQEGGVSGTPTVDSWTAQNRFQYDHKAPATTANPIQAGSSDVSKPNSFSTWINSGWAGDNDPYRFQYGTLGGGGGG